MEFKILISDLPSAPTIGRETEVTHFIWNFPERYLRLKTKTRYLNSEMEPVPLMSAMVKDFDCDNTGYIDPVTGWYVDVPIPEDSVEPAPEDVAGLVKDYDFYLGIKNYQSLGLSESDLEGLPPKVVAALNSTTADLIKNLIANQINIIDHRGGFNK